jgi:hypothetical protein
MIENPGARKKTRLFAPKPLIQLDPKPHAAERNRHSYGSKIQLPKKDERLLALSR